jgi:internalin A
MSEQVKQLIEENIRTQSKTLDLSNCGLTDLNEIPKLFECVWLESLSFLDGYLDSKNISRAINQFDVIKDLFITSINKGEENQICNLTVSLHKLCNLKSLIFSNVEQAENTEQIGKLTALEILIVGNVKKCNFISSLENLKILLVISPFSEGISAISHLKKLEVLSLSKCNIKSLSFLSELHELRHLILESNEIECLSPISKLFKLKSLDLSGNKLQSLEGLEQLSKLERLEVGYNQFSDLSPISKLLALKSLNLYENKLQSLEGLEELSQLEKLDVGYNEISDLSPISKLVGLKSLDLSWYRLQSLEGLEEFKYLENLDARNNQFSDLSPISKLLELKSLDLSGNKLQSLEGLEELSQLENLNAWQNQVSNLSPISKLLKLKSLNLSMNNLQSLEGLEELAQLERLEVGYNQFSDLSPISKLLELKSLNLGGNNLQSLEGLEELAQLETLKVRFNQVSDLSPISKLLALKSLNLSDNKLQSLEGLEKLKKLEKLNLSSIQIGEFSHRFLRKLPKLKELKLAGNPISNLPKETFDLKEDYGSPQNVLQEVKDYFQSIEDKENRSLNEAKLILVGVGEVGKSELVEALSEPNYEFVEGRKTTQGIRIKQWELPNCEREGEQFNFLANVWDFAGQEINYGTHQFFLTQNSVYLFVWENRKGSEQANQFEYWLNVVSLLSKNAPILVVQNKVDANEGEINQKDWKKKFPHIVDFYKTSCKDQTGLPELQTQIRQQLLQLPNTKDIWNKDRFDIRRLLEQRTEAHIPYTEYLRICDEHDLERKEAVFLAKQLHDIGVILHYGDDISLKDTVVLQTGWSIDAAYCLIDAKKNQGGRFEKQELHSIWQADRFEGKQAFLLELMKRFELVFQLQGSDIYIIPEGLPIYAPEQVEQWQTTTTAKSLRFEYHYDFMPKGILSRFICRIHSHIKGELFWRYGVVLSYEQSEAKVILNEVEEVVSVEVWGKQADKLLAIIRSHIDHIHYNLKNPPLEEMIPCYCEKCQENDPHFFEHDYLKMCLEEGDKELRCINRTKVSIAKLLEGIIDPRKDASEQLIRLIRKNKISDFYSELQRLRISDSYLEDLKERYMMGKEDHKYNERLELWVKGYFEEIKMV